MRVGTAVPTLLSFSNDREISIFSAELAVVFFSEMAVFSDPVERFSDAARSRAGVPSDRSSAYCGASRAVPRMLCNSMSDPKVEVGKFAVDLYLPLPGEHPPRV